MSSQLVSDAAVGFFGKMPSRGDFVRRGLTGVFVERWDEWLQGVLAESRASLGEQWLDVYLTAPIWRFALGAGVVDDHAWCGAIMPSVDRVNRYFPLTVAARGHRQASVPGLVRGASAWYQTMEDLLMEALDDDSRDVDAFHAALQAVPGLPGGAAVGASVETVAQGLRVLSSEAEEPWAEAALDLVLARLLDDQLGAASVFWRAGAGGGELRVTAGLPSPSSCGNWFFGADTFFAAGAAAVTPPCEPPPGYSPRS